MAAQHGEFPVARRDPDARRFDPAIATRRTRRSFDRRRPPLKADALRLDEASRLR
jgi:hypothetical protein